MRIACYTFVVTLAAMAAAHAMAEDRPTLSLPVACAPHKTCFIQNYVDHGTGKDVRDYACGTATYQKNSGTDFRVLSAAVTKTGFPVVASADGTVKGMRDGMSDIFFKEARKSDIAGRECGNGVSIDHGNGWETQYCHMKQGSLRVAKGQTVKRGDPLGEIGFSGEADYAHLRFSVRKDGRTIDPFWPDAEAGRCRRDAAGPGLWEPPVIAAFPYKNGEIVDVGFAAEAPTLDAMEKDHTAVVTATRQSPLLLIYSRMINLIAGDRIRLIVNGPGGTLVEEVSPPIDRAKATYMSFAGKKRGEQLWSMGRYEGRVELMRDGGVVAARLATIDLR